MSNVTFHLFTIANQAIVPYNRTTGNTASALLLKMIKRANEDRWKCNQNEMENSIKYSDNEMQ